MRSIDVREDLAALERTTRCSAIGRTTHDVDVSVALDHSESRASCLHVVLVDKQRADRAEDVDRDGFDRVDERHPRGLEFGERLRYDKRREVAAHDLVRVRHSHDVRRDEHVGVGMVAVLEGRFELSEQSGAPLETG